MSEWREVILEDITTKIGDGLHGTPKYDSNGEYHFINGNNLKNGKVIVKSDTKKVTRDEAIKYQKPLSSQTILLSINGTIGNLALYNSEKCMLGKSACYINVSDEVDVKFLYYHCLDEEFQFYIEMVATGTTIPNVPLKGIRQYSFNLPSIKEQKVIAEVLSSLDDKIDLLHRQNKTLEELAQTLFRQWFIEEAEDEWEVGTLSYFANNPRKSIKPLNIEPDTKYIGLEHIERKNISLTQSGDSSAVASNKYQFEENDILFGKLRPYFHKVCFTSHDGICSTDILVIRPKKESYFAYTLLAFNQVDVINYATSGSEGTRMPRTNWNVLSQYPVQMPSEHMLKKFNFMIMPSIEKIKINQTQIQTLEKMRDTLLPKLMSGDVRVKHG